MKKPRRVEVTWKDACLRSSGACRRADIRKQAGLAVRKTVGWLVERDSEVTILAITFDPAENNEQEDSFDDLYTIPTGWIKRVKRL